MNIGLAIMLQEAEARGFEKGMRNVFHILKWLNEGVSEEEIVQRLDKPQEDCKKLIDQIRKILDAQIPPE